MNIRRFGVSIAALTAVCPALCNASPAKASFDACLSAFEKALAPSDAVGRSFKVVYAEEPSSMLDIYYPTSYTFELQASKAKTGEVVARMRCVASPHRGVALTDLLEPKETTARVAQR
jgi:hypothetical protein